MLVPKVDDGKRLCPCTLHSWDAVAWPLEVVGLSMLKIRAQRPKCG